MRFIFITYTCHIAFLYEPKYIIKKIIFFIQKIPITITRNGQFIITNFPTCNFIIYLKLWYFAFHGIIGCHFHFSSINNIFMFKYFIIFLTLSIFSIYDGIDCHFHNCGINNFFILHYIIILF